MFNFLKDKLKTAVEKFSKKAEEEVEEVTEPVKEIKEEPEKEKVIEEPKEEKLDENEIERKFLTLTYEQIKKILDSLGTAFKEPIENIPKQHIFATLQGDYLLKDIKKEIEKVKEILEKKTIFKKITEKVTTKKLPEEKFNKIFQELEIILLENNVAVEVIDKIKQDLKTELLEKPIKKSQIEKIIKQTLKDSIKEILDVPKLDLDNIIKKCKKENKPCVILVIGYNGAGKSITCAKLALKLKKKNYKPLLAAGDTFRSAGDIQLVEYGKLVDVPVIYNPDTKDSCSVIFDAIQKAKTKHFDIVIADTSGRIHSNTDLMDELKKIARVNNPDITILILDSLTGSDIIQQMQEFDKIIAVDGIILTKVDVDEKGGAFLSAVYTGKKPVLYIGSGQNMSNLEEFNIDKILKNLGLENGT